MPASDTAAAALGAASCFARALWGQALGCRPLAAGDAPPAAQRPVLERSAEGAPVAGALLLPQGRPDLGLAAAAHAAAHLRYGAPAQSRQGLKPVQQALFGALEDARVEALACAELPGLLRLWMPWHQQATRHLGHGFEDLLAQLSHSLLDTAEPAPHPWVRQVCHLFREGPEGRPPDPAAMRALASRLGHDIGQMRLPFNPRSYRVAAAYRDDNAHLWLPSDEALPAVPPAGAPDTAAPGLAPPDSETDQLPWLSYPEWDQRIGRYRRDWCQVRVSETAPVTAPLTGPPVAARHMAHRLLAGRRATLRGGAVPDGHELHPVGLVDHAIARRSRQVPDGRCFQDRRAPPTALSVLLLIDASVSATGHTPAWQAQARDLCWALRRLGCRSAVWCFGSAGRRCVRMHRVKDWDQPVQQVDWSRMPLLGSTRAGAALRHAVWLCRQGGQALAEHTHIVLLTDGELHDIDIHEAGYLDADLARGVAEAVRLGLRVHAVVPAAARAGLPRGAFMRRLARPVAPGRWAQSLVAALQSTR
jgi:hypothetical protein